MKPRRILLVSWAFHPALGGIETSSFLFAKELAERGHAITVVTMTAGMVDGYPFKVVRNPGAATLCNLMKQADLVWHNNISLRFAWPLAVFKRPLIVTHQTWLGTENSGLALAPRLKRALCATAHNVFISQAVDNAAHLPGTIIPNPYDDAVFRLMPEVSRDRDIVFVGRFVKDKGVDILIAALAILAARGLAPSVTLIGTGPEQEALRAQADQAGLGQSVSIPGPLSGAALAAALNRHRIMVIPSRWPEPFGIVALEGAACGCVPVGTQGGGLPEAIGPCGPLVANDDPQGLVDALSQLLGRPDLMAEYRRNAPAHLAQFTAAAVVDRYEQVIAEALTIDQAASG